MANEPDGLPVKYLGGFAGHPVKALGGGFWKLRADVDAMRVFWGSQKGSWTGTYRWITLREEPWDRLQAMHLASASATRANLPAIAAFGVLGLAARREPGTLIALSYADGDVFLSARATGLEMKSTFERFVLDVPAAAGKITFDGVVLGQTPQQVPVVEAAADVFEQIRELGLLRDAGLLTAAEFDVKKAELLARI